MTRKFYLGLDGGATKNEAAVMDSEGRILAVARNEGAHVASRISKTILSRYSQLIDKVCKQAKISRKQIAYYGFGICGVDFADEIKAQKRSLVKPLGIDDSKSVLVNDGVVALWGGTRSAKAVCLQIGTGYTAAYRAEYGKEESFDQFNCGIVVDLRKDVYVYSMRSWDGREIDSVLPKLLMEYFDEPDPAMLIKKLNRKFYEKQKVANALSILNKAVKKKDRLAIKVLDNTAKVYAHDIGTMIKRIGPGKIDVVLGGGVILNGPPLLTRLIREKVREDYPGTTAHNPRFAPSVGACLMAAFHDGADTASLYKKAAKGIKGEAK